MDSEEVVIELCKLANELPDLPQEEEDKIFWGLWLTTEIFIPDKKKLEKVRTMTLLNGKNIPEILRKKEYEIREERDIEIAGNMIERGFPVNQIAEITGLDANSIHQLTLEK